MANKINYQKNVYTKFFTVAPGVWGLKDVLVNMYMVLNPFDGNWVLVDTGLKWSAPKIRKMAKQLFGGYSAPSSIILTHGHFDHVGSVQSLAEHWKVPVFAHYLEIPYLTGKSSYPPPDPTVGGGIMSLMAWLYPATPINIWNHINVLPENGRVPGLPEWKYIHTPGHTPGHISLFRESDRVLIAGDAFVTTKAESAFSTMLQTKTLSGPPKYFTYDWALARDSVNTLHKLEPEIAATGHGHPMEGTKMRESLQNLNEYFYQSGVPSQGRYVDEPAITNAAGVVYTPPTNVNKRLLAINILSITVLAAAACFVLVTKNKKSRKRKEALSYEVW